MDNTLRDIALAKELSRRILVLIDAVASDLPPHVVMDGVMGVGMAFAVAGDMDEEKLATNWLSAVKEMKEMRRATPP